MGGGVGRRGKKVAMLRRFRGPISLLALFIETIIRHAGGQHRRPTHLSDELLVIAMATQFEYN